MYTRIACSTTPLNENHFHFVLRLQVHKRHLTVESKKTKTTDLLVYCYVGQFLMGTTIHSAKRKRPFIIFVVVVIYVHVPTNNCSVLYKTLFSFLCWFSFKKRTLTLKLPSKHYRTQTQPMAFPP